MEVVRPLPAEQSKNISRDGHPERPACRHILRDTQPQALPSCNSQRENPDLELHSSRLPPSRAGRLRCIGASVERRTGKAPRTMQCGSVEQQSRRSHWLHDNSGQQVGLLPNDLSELRRPSNPTGSPWGLGDCDYAPALMRFRLSTACPHEVSGSFSVGDTWVRHVKGA